MCARLIIRVLLVLSGQSSSAPNPARVVRAQAPEELTWKPTVPRRGETGNQCAMAG